MGVQLVGSAKLMRFVNDTKVNIVCWANYETQHQKAYLYILLQHPIEWYIEKAISSIFV